ncbi:hypothetical protein [Botrimarina hoheduenensis]|uniref:L-seryl-tRNA(Sec) selenium transferase n=1 Tax=Botrimarina hoheduenensis TaxID=2528000 RepID=A0A5C5WE49_9BACT|nr:hypothetical protein [Botrimarina hoheduenensis]TWT48325.1 L-seryl-tRNA(Sec) selenium transferase [Botrimarina hoheduenensis]
MSPQDLLGKLPSLNELLDHPGVRKAVDRWNRSETLARVRVAIDDLGAELSRRTEDLRGTSPTELLDRLIHRLDVPAALPVAPIINASGELWGPRGSAAPLAEAAIEQLVRVASMPHETDANLGAPLAKQLGAEHALVFATSGSALRATFRAHAQQTRTVIVAKSETTDPAPGCSLGTLTSSCGLALVEIGGPVGATVQDYVAAAAAPGALVLRRGCEFYRLEGASARPSTAELAAALRPRGALLVEDLGGAAPVATPHATDAPNARSVLEAGADVVLLAGVGLVGGPPSAIVAGTRKAIEPIERSADFAMDEAADLTLAALLATLKLFDEPEQLRFAHPLYRLIDTPLENLQARAERLAPQLAAGKGILSAIPIELGPERAVGPLGLVRLPSWGIALEGIGEAELRSRKPAERPTILPRRQPIDGRTVLDLRTMVPADDLRLVASLTAVPPDDAQPSA